MAEILLFHHIQGLTHGVIAFADALRAGGHTVHTPDLFDGRTFDSIEAGQAYLGEVGFDEVRERGILAAEGLPAGLVYAGFSLGVMPAQQLTQNRPGARGALLYHSFADPSYFGTWPVAVSYTHLDVYKRQTQEFAVSLPPRHYDLAGRILADAVEQAAAGVPLDGALRAAAERAAYRVVENRAHGRGSVAPGAHRVGLRASGGGGGAAPGQLPVPLLSLIHI